MADDKNEGEESVEQTELEKKSKKELIKIIEEMVEKENQRLKNQKALNESSKEHLETLRDTASLLNDMEAVREASLALAEQEILTAMKKAQAAAENDEIRKNIQEETLKFIEQVKKGEKDSLGKIAERLGMKDEELIKLSEQIELNNDIIEGQKKYGREQRVVLKGIASALGMTREYKDTFAGAIVELNKGLGSKDPKERAKAMKTLADNFQRFFNLQNMALAVFDKIYAASTKMFGEFDKAQASLAAATGQGDAFRGTLYEVGREGNLFGISMDDAGKAIGTMVDQTSNFTSMSKATQASLALNVAKMEKLGVATADSAQIFQNFNQALGMTADESMNMQTELAMAGVSIGVNAAKMTKDFNASLSTLMVYGRESVDVFKGIAAAAKAAGVETSTLLGIASKFDTFSGAAEGAGKLNALLGTQLSTTEMLMATEDERIRMLVESVQSQGVAFQDMDRFTQKAIANAAGITDMAEANRIFGMSLEAYDENERKLNASADAQKKLDDAVAKTVPVMNQFKLLGAEIVVALEPFLETLESAAKYLTDMFKEMDTETKELIGTVAGLAASFVLLMPILKIGGTLFTALKVMGGTLLPTIATTAPAAGGGIAGFAASILPALPVLLKFGLIVTMIVGSLALLAGAIALVGDAFGSSKMDLKIAESEAKMAQLQTQASEAEARASEFQFKSAEAMASIVTGNHEGALASVKAMVEEVNKMGQDVKVSSTIENLALITAGKASSITGERVVASQTSVTANVQNFFEGMEMTLMIDDTTALKTYVAKVASGEA
jgi:hypothetical protein